MGDYCIKQRFTTITPFSKWELLLKERICSQRELILSSKSSSLKYGKSLLRHKVSSLECYYFYYCVMDATPMISVAVVLLRACVMLTIYSRNHGVLKSITQEMPHSHTAEKPMTQLEENHITLTATSQQ